MTEKKDLSPRQREVYDLIVWYRRRHGVSPTYREIAHRFGWSSVNGVSEFLDALVAKGWVRRAIGLSRSIVPVDDATSADIEALKEIAAILLTENGAEAKVEQIARVISDRARLDTEPPATASGS